MTRAAILAGLAMLCLLAGCATTAGSGAPGDQVLRVSAEQIARCQQGGGCHLLTREEMVNLAARGYELAVQDMDCRRGSL